MTAAPLADHDDPGPSLDRDVEVDMRCSASLRREIAGPGRCQLLAGHDGEHSLMYSGADARHVLAWTGDDPPAPATGDWRLRPWMRGFPFPAWFEAAGTDAVS